MTIALFALLRSYSLVLREGISFLFACRKKGSLLPSVEYLKWRLGTMYGSFCTLDGVVLFGPMADEKLTFRHRTLGELMGAAIDDWKRVRDFLIWRRSMLVRARR